MKKWELIADEKNGNLSTWRLDVSGGYLYLVKGSDGSYPPSIIFVPCLEAN